MLRLMAGRVDDDTALAEKRLQDLVSSLKENDPEITEVSTHRLPFGYGRRLGEALLVNTVVTDFSLCVSTFFGADDAEMDGADSMLNYLRGSSASLKKVDVLGTAPWLHRLSPELTDQIHSALARNPHIVHVETISDVINDAFAHLVQSTTSIRTLQVNVMDYFDVAPPMLLLMGPADQRPLRPQPPHIVPVPLAFEANQTLECLTLRVHGTIDTCGVLRALATHSKLTDLRLALSHNARIGTDHFQAVAYLIQSSQMIQTLTLDSYRFDKGYMELVLAALQSNKVTTKWIVTNCLFDEEATEALVPFMQAQANKGDSTLREFRLECSEFFRQPVFRERSVASVLCGMVGAGSSLDRLSIGATVHGFDANEFFRGLVAADANGMTKLSSLVLEQHLNRAELEALATYLRQTAYLRDLSIGGLARDSPASRRLLVSAIRSNGSLLNFNVCSSEAGTIAFMDATTSRLVEACLDRNRLLPELLNKPLLPTASITSSIDTPHEQSGDETTDVGTVNVVAASGSAPTDLKRFPALFRSAQQAPRTSPNGMLIGFLATTIQGSVGATLDDAY